MSGDRDYGDEVWKDDDKVRTVAGKHYDPWKTFNDCCGAWKFPDGLMHFLMEQGFKCPTPIQAHTWPALLDGNDVIGVAKTGSGKTLGYLLPGYIKVKRQEMQPGNSCDHSKGPMMLVCAPTRELCQQIFDESEKFGKPAQIQTVCVYGGASKSQQQRGLWGGPQCVVATPGRLNDFIRDGSIRLGQILYLVLDEADRMLDMGFMPQVREIAQHIPPERQTALFTATWPREVRDLAASLVKSATHIQVGSTDSAATNADITQHVIEIRGESDKMRYLETEIFPKLQASGGAALVFTRTKKAASSLYSTLSRAGAPIVCLHGDMEQRERDNALWNFKQGRAKVMVATDVAQRGLDIKNVDCVVNYDAADNMEAYVHRIGRTGRAGEKGEAYTFLYGNDRSQAQQIATVMKKAGQQIPQSLQNILGGGGGYGGGGGGGGYRGGGYGGPELNGQWGGKYASGGGGGGYGR